MVETGYRGVDCRFPPSTSSGCTGMRSKRTRGAWWSYTTWPGSGVGRMDRQCGTWIAPGGAAPKPLQTHRNHRPPRTAQMAARVGAGEGYRGGSSGVTALTPLHIVSVMLATIVAVWVVDSEACVETGIVELDYRVKLGA